MCVYATEAIALIPVKMMPASVRMMNTSVALILEIRFLIVVDCLIVRDPLQYRSALAVVRTGQLSKA